jgi:hypothetical protein
MTLATVQIAMSMALLVPAGLFAKSLFNVSRIDLGLNTDHLVLFNRPIPSQPPALKRCSAHFAS